MITEDYTSYEVAKLLKDKGFDGICRAGYTSHGNLHVLEVKEYLTNKVCPDTYWACAAPTHQMACRWLREVYNVAIEINSIWIVGFGYNYIARIVVEGESKKCLKHYNYYEEAVEAAIKYTLENLI